MDGFIYRYNVKGIDRMGNAFLIDDHDNSGVECDEILMRHAELLAVAQFKSERAKSIVKPFSDLIDNHRRSVYERDCKSMLRTEFRHRRNISALLFPLSFSMRVRHLTTPIVRECTTI